MARPPAKKGTTVRSLITALRVGIRLLGTVAPGLAARVVVRLWMTPVRPRLRPELALPMTGTMRSGGLDLPIWCFGEGPPVYLVHGWGGRADQLSPLVWPLVQAGHKVVLFDGPGHGRAPGKLSSGPAIAAALRTAVDLHGAPHAIVAHSFGAAATTLALNAGTGAGRVVLLAPPANLGGFIDRFGTMVGASRAVMTRTRDLVARRLGMPWSAFSLESLAGRQTAPALVIHDRDDQEVKIDEGEAVARTWPGAELVVTRGLGHWRILRDAGVLHRVVSWVSASGRPLEMAG